MRSLTVQISQPCQQPWAEMQPNQQGRFCATCQKTVVDYTELSDQELDQKLRQGVESTCGRFRNEQLNRPLQHFSSGTVPVWRCWLSLFTVSVVSWQTARAQSNTLSRPASQQTQPASTPSYEPVTRPVQINQDGTSQWAITGRVMLMDTNGNLSPVVGAVVSACFFVEPWQTQTDSNGTYRLLAHPPKHITQLAVRVSTSGRYRDQITVKRSSSVPSITADDIILYPLRKVKDISAGGMTIVRGPSGWQRFKRRFFP